MKWAILSWFDTYRDLPKAFGGLTVGNLCIFMEDPDAEKIERAFQQLERDGWLKVHNVNGVAHAVFKEK